MKVLTVHNYYGNYTPGGEGNVFENETTLLRDHGHEVYQYKCTNDDLLRGGFASRIKAYYASSWSMTSYYFIQDIIKKFKPNIMHVHNLWAILSPSIFRAAKDLGVSTIYTPHNYRLVCPAGMLMRRGRICEDCIGRGKWRVILHRCYRNSFLASIARYRLYQKCQKEKVWDQDIDAFIALTVFGKQKFISDGLPANRIYVKPNFINDPLKGEEAECHGKGAIYIGRLSFEKGLPVLLKAWHQLDYPLTIIGQGPLREKLERQSSPNVKFVGFLLRDQMWSALRDSAMLIFPSEYYEGFGLVSIEAMAMGRPVIASKLGAMAEIVEHGKTGLLFKPGNSDDLKEKVEILINNLLLRTQLGNAAREEYLQKYTPKRNYNILMDIYKRAIHSHSL